MGQPVIFPRKTAQYGTQTPPKSTPVHVARRAVNLYPK